MVPADVFDTQLAAAFLGYKHPVSFRRLAENELGLRRSDKKPSPPPTGKRAPSTKTTSATPFDDVAPLPCAHATNGDQTAQTRPAGLGQEENCPAQNADYYAEDPNDEALNNSMMKSLNFKEKILMLRLYQWRREQAEI